MNKLMVANLKMNLDKEQIIEYKKILEENLIPNLIVCPPDIYLDMMISNKYKVCAQDAYYIDEGAYTGEISFFQLKKLGIEYSLVGHSERRKLFNETNEVTSLKVEASIRNEITPIICIGENLLEKESNNTLNIIKDELTKALSKNIPNNLIIAYEPVWAIGTGNTATLDDIKYVHSFIKEYVNKTYNKNVKVLYGGSVSLDNISEILSLNEVDGVLIGGASKKASNLIDMYNKTKNVVKEM